MQADVVGRDGRAGGAPQAAGIGGLGVAAGLDRLERDRPQAPPDRQAEEAGRDQRLAYAGVRTCHEQTARAQASTSASAARRRARSAGSWADDMVMRRRDNPAGTVGGRMAGMNRPRALSASATARARASLPSTSGRIGPVGM